MSLPTPGEGYVPPAERIAVFDNDGTLWAEQPMYFQLQFALDRVPAIAAENPTLARTPPFDSVLKHDREAMAAFGHNELAQILLQTHSGMTTDEFADVVNDNCLIGLVHHNDAKREWAYDRDSHIGRLDNALDTARERHWLIVDMKSDWLTVFPC